MQKSKREQIYNKYNGRCAYCGQKIEYKDMQVDHIRAKYLGGEDSIDNYMPSCKACNFYKSTLDIESFKKRIETIPERLNKIFIFTLAIKYGLIEIKDKKVKFLMECDRRNGKN
jgi:5-methylcytosine-specific restriction endonuclease McrA